MLALLRGEVGPDPAPWLLWSGEKTARIGPFGGFPPPREVAGQGQHPRLPPVPAPPLAPGQLPGAPGLGEEGGGYVLICCEGGALGGLWFGLGLGLFWFFFYWRFS